MQGIEVQNVVKERDPAIYCNYSGNGIVNIICKRQEN